jgi:hypothetical protein
MQAETIDGEALGEVAACPATFPPLQVCAGCARRVSVSNRWTPVSPAPDRWGGCDLWLDPADPSMGLPW